MVARHSADWVRAAVVYEINTRAFSPTGDFAGVAARLDDLVQLGVTVLWLMPVHPVGELHRKGRLGSPYSVRDYLAIDPAFGTAEDLRALVRAAHERGLKVILDIVANHTAWDAVLTARPSFHHRNAAGELLPAAPDWTDVVRLDYQHAGVREYMRDMLASWIRDFDLDGFRCDVAGLVPADFWEEARDFVETIKPETFWLAEWHAPELLHHAFDAGYAWPFHKTLEAVLQAGAPAVQLKQIWQREAEVLPPQGLELRFSDNHDERRAVARFGERGALVASLLVFTLDGVPLLYNGQEIGDTTESGGPALFDRLPIFWENGALRPHFRPFYEKLIRLRRAHAALQQGTVEWVDNSDWGRVVSFVRCGPRQEFLVAVNCSSRPFQGSVDGLAQPLSLPPWGGLVRERTWGTMLEL